MSEVPQKSEPALSEVPVKDLEAEIARRGELRRSEIRSAIAAHEAAIKDLRAELGEAVPSPNPARAVIIPAAERKVRILRVFDVSTQPSLPAGHIAQKTQIRGSTLTTTLTELVGEGKLVRLGNKRSTTYRLPEAEAA